MKWAGFGFAILWVIGAALTLAFWGSVIYLAWRLVDWVVTH